MCGISGIVGHGAKEQLLWKMVVAQDHRGPDAQGIYIDPTDVAGLGHNRLSIIDLSVAGNQPMRATFGPYSIVFNGEIYNYLELRRELESTVTFSTQSDTEVLLAAYQKWGMNCLEHFIGMFAFLLWDEQENRLFAARDRFGVKPLYYAYDETGQLFFASEIKALHAAGIPRRMNTSIWSTYLTYGLYEHHEETFWHGVYALAPGHALSWKAGTLNRWCWYDLATVVAEETTPLLLAEAEDQYLALLKESIQMRFRADVPIAINLSGGLDSSALLGLVQAVRGADSQVKAFTFTTGDSRYDELPWVKQMLTHTQHPFVECRLNPEDVPLLAQSVQYYQDEPFGGLPTLAYAHLFAQARQSGIVVLLDGQGMDEQWAGYDYYRTAIEPHTNHIQGAMDRSIRPECLVPEFRNQAQSLHLLTFFADPVQQLQYRDTRYTKIPRALRFNDRVSMRSSTELREPFLDHRLFEFAFRQPTRYKIQNGQGKWFLREILRILLPEGVVQAPKRPVQTPQREWLRGPLHEWANGLIEEALKQFAGVWLDAAAVRLTWQQYTSGQGDNSFYIWQWLNLGLMIQQQRL